MHGLSSSRQEEGEGYYFMEGNADDELSEVQQRLFYAAGD